MVGEMNDSIVFNSVSLILKGYKYLAFYFEHSFVLDCVL